MIREIIVARGKTAKKPRKLKHPRAFWVVPVKLNSRLRSHSHVLGQAAIPPCPIGSVFAGKFSIGPVNFCLYVDKEGGEFIVQC